MRSRSIPSNAAWLLSGRLGTAGAAVVVAVIAARDLGEADFGTYAAVLAAGLFANTFVTFGTDTLVVRSVAAGAADDAVRPSLGLQWLLAAPLIVVGLVVALLVDSGAPIALQAVALAPGIWGTTATSVLRGQQRMDLVAASMLVGAVVLVVGSLIAMAGEPRVWAYVLAAVVAQTCTAASASWWARLPVAARFERAFWRRSAPFAVMVVSSAAVAACGVVALRLFHGDSEAGLFAAANRITEGLRFAPAAVFGAAFPAMATGLHREARYRRGVQLLLAGCAGVAAMVVVLADELVERVFGTYDGAGDVLAVLAVGLVPLVLRLRWSFELLADGDERWAAATSVTVAVATVVGVTIAATVGSAISVALVLVGGLWVHAGALGLRVRSASHLAG